MDDLSNIDSDLQFLDEKDQEEVNALRQKADGLAQQLKGKDQQQSGDLVRGEIDKIQGKIKQKIADGKLRAIDKSRSRV